jgi:uncharacterized protein YacL
LKTPPDDDVTDKPPRIYFDPEPDPERDNVRMGCGAVFGLFFALYVLFKLAKWFHFSDYVLYIFITLAVIFSCLFAYLAMRRGDSFWEKFFR